MNDIGIKTHVLNHSRVRCVVGTFDKNLYEVSIWTVHRAFISFILHKSIFIHFLNYGTRFYDKYIASDDRKKYMDDDESRLFQNKRLESYTM